MIKTKFLNNLLLSFIWLALTGSFTLGNFIFGFIMGYMIIWIMTETKWANAYIGRGLLIILFIFYFLYELIKANLQVAFDVITPKFYMKPGIIKVPLTAKSDLEITMLANLISLTPGTLSLDVSDDRKVLYVHAMYVKDKEKFIQSIKNGFEKRLLEIIR